MKPLQELQLANFTRVNNHTLYGIYQENYIEIDVKNKLNVADTIAMRITLYLKSDAKLLLKRICNKYKISNIGRYWWIKNDINIVPEKENIEAIIKSMIEDIKPFSKRIIPMVVTGANKDHVIGMQYKKS